MKKFLNNLQQTVSFKVMSIMGYLLAFGVFAVIFLIEYFLHNIHYEEYNVMALVSWTVLLKTLIYIFFPVIALSLLITGIFEYKFKKAKNEFKDTNKGLIFHLYNLGLIFTLLWPLDILIIALLNYIVMSKQYTLL